LTDVFDDLRELGLPVQAFEALRDDVRALLATGESGSPALVIDIGRGRVVSARAARGKAERLLVIERTG
jgi:hypothetical protein